MLNKYLLSIFIINMIDDKAVLIEHLRLNKRESDIIWSNFYSALEILYQTHELPEDVKKHLRSRIDKLI